MHAHNFIVKFIITGGSWEEGVPICDEQIEDIHDLQHNKIYIVTLQ